MKFDLSEMSRLMIFVKFSHFVGGKFFGDPKNYKEYYIHFWGTVDGRHLANFDGRWYFCILHLRLLKLLRGKSTERDMLGVSPAL